MFLVAAIAFAFLAGFTVARLLGAPLEKVAREIVAASKTIRTKGA